MNSANLYDRTVSCEDSLRDVYASLNLYGFEIIDDLKTDDETKDKILKYIAYAYSYNSEMLRNVKDRAKNKEIIAKKVGLDITNNLVIDILKNKNSTTQHYISWWLTETQHPLWMRYISGLDLESELLELVRTGLDITITGTVKDIDKAAKQLTKDSKLKAEAFKAAVVVRKQVDDDKEKLEKETGFLQGIVKKEVPDYLNGDNWAEWYEKESRKKRTPNKPKFIAIEETAK